MKRFWSKVDSSSKDGCWEWQAYRLPTGYGWFNLDGKPVQASRVAYMLAVGEIPEGMSVCHRCDNPACCRPDHLFLGTHRENMRDALRKGRLVTPTNPPGERHPKAKLTEDQVRFIRSSKIGCTTLGRMMGISSSNIKLIRRRKTWRHIA